MSVLSFWGQLVESVSSFGHTDVKSARRTTRQISTWKQEQDLDADSDLEDLPPEKLAAFDAEAATLESIGDYHAHQKELSCARSEASLVFATRAPEKAQQLVEDFCARTPPTRVKPNRKELEELWTGCSALISGTESKMAKAMISTAIVYGISGQLSAENDWKPQLRALTLLEFLHHQPGLLEVAHAERFIAEMVMEETPDQLRYLSTEVEACREVAMRLLNCEEPPELSPRGKGRTEVAGNAPTLKKWQPYDDSCLSECKANVPGEVAAEDEVVIHGSYTQLGAIVLAYDDSGLSESKANVAVDVAAEDEVTIEGSCLQLGASFGDQDKFDNVESTDWTSYSVSSAVATATVDVPSSSTATPASDTCCSNGRLEAVDPFAALAAGLNDEIFAIAPFADLAERSLLSVSEIKGAERTSSMDSAGSTHPGSFRGRNGSVVSLGSEESLEAQRQAAPTAESKALQGPRLARTVPVIPWGIEDELPVVDDPLATLWI